MPSYDIKMTVGEHHEEHSFGTAAELLAKVEEYVKAELTGPGKIKEPKKKK